ncbi:MAG: hypothetical protein JXB88_15410 [Spirochaetales bacterium]|nr:hypothetical protein [Spirochaetales bacterium]
MENKRIVITRTGALSSLGMTKNDFWNNLKAGRSGVNQISSFNTEDSLSRYAYEIKDFDANQWLGKKGLRNIDRSTRLLLAAITIELTDILSQIDESFSPGLVVGTAFGSVKSIHDFFLSALEDGVLYVKPMEFPNIVINSPASHANIRFLINHLSATISNGYTSSLEAIFYAYYNIVNDMSDALIVGSLEELCFESFSGFQKIGLLSTEKNCTPFNPHSNGTLLGEGVSLLVLDSLEHARSRNEEILAEIKGFGSYFSGSDENGVEESITLALENACLQPDDISCIYSGANGIYESDVKEARAIKKIFGKCETAIPVTAIKSMIGECYGASGGLLSVAAVNSILEGIIPPSMTGSRYDLPGELNIVDQEFIKTDIEHVLVNSYGCGNNASLILSKWKE